MITLRSCSICKHSIMEPGEETHEPRTCRAFLLADLKAANEHLNVLKARVEKLMATAGSALGPL